MPHAPAATQLIVCGQQACSKEETCGMRGGVQSGDVQSPYGHTRAALWTHTCPSAPGPNMRCLPLCPPAK
eukprot:1959368-Prymnesium_polylepis.1